MQLVNVAETLRNGMYRMPPLRARTAVGVQEEESFPGTCIALWSRGNTPVALKPDTIVYGVIAFDQADENSEGNW